MTASLAAYRVLTDLAAPALSLWLRRRLARGKEDPERLPERKGIAGLPRPGGKLLWLHGASVGEGLSMLPLIEALLQANPDLRFLVTTGTVTSARLMAERLPSAALHQFIPLDRSAWVARFLDHWRPDAALWLESELWPNLLTMADDRHIPLLLVNARLSERSAEGWERLPGLARLLLSSFRLVLAQGQGDAARLGRLGAAVEVAGNLKAAAAPLPVDARAFAALEGAIAERPRWLAASTHPGEEMLALRVHRALSRPGLLTIIVPRHPERGPAIAAELTAEGAMVARRGAGEQPARDTDIYLADTLGELGLFYRLSPVSFVGKSLAGDGGQNPLEPARLGSAVLFGPAMTNFREMAEAMTAVGAATVVPDWAGLAAALATFLDAPDQLAAARARAEAFAGREAEVLDRVTQRVIASLPHIFPAAGADHAVLA